MFVYFPIKRPGGTAAGSVRAEQGRTVLRLNVPTDAVCWLFSADTPRAIVPDAPLACEMPRALLGVQSGKVVLFGVAPGVTASVGELYAELSRNNTKQAENEKEDAAKTVIEDTENGEDGVNITQTEVKTPIEARAKAVYASLETLRPAPVLADNEPKKGQTEPYKPQNMVQKEDWTDALLRVDGSESTVRGIDLFPRVFPGATWRFSAQDGTLPHFEGIWKHGGERIRILAVRGAYSPTPPPGLAGFTRYLRADGAGYWVRLLPMEREMKE